MCEDTPTDILSANVLDFKILHQIYRLYEYSRTLIYLKTVHNQDLYLSTTIKLSMAFNVSSLCRALVQ